MSDFIERVAMQGVYNWTWHYKFGKTQSLASSATNEAIWSSGGDYTGFPTQTETLSIVSASASDTAKTLTIQGLDANFDSIEETVTLTGQTPVLTTKAFHRAPRAFIASGAINVGDITINHSTTTANVFAVLPATYGQTQICAFTVPNNCNCLIKGISIQLSRAAGLAGSALVSTRVRLSGETDFRAREISEITTSAPGGYRYEGGIFLPEKTDIKIMVESISGNSSSFSGEIEYLLLYNGETD